jgi:hypothetical protein
MGKEGKGGGRRGGQRREERRGEYLQDCASKGSLRAVSRVRGSENLSTEIY